MYSTDEIKALRIELAQAIKSDDIVAALEAPVISVNSNASLLHCAAQEGLLLERFLSTMLTQLFKSKNREHFNRIINDDSLGFKTLRSFWDITACIRDNDPNLTLDYIIEEYRQSDPKSLTRIKWFSLIFGQSYRENNWSFILAWSKVAINEELSIVHKRYFYGAIIGLINNNHKEEAKDLLLRRTPFMSDLDKLFFTIPFYKTKIYHLPYPSQRKLIHNLHTSLPNKGLIWDWFCKSYLEKMATTKINLINVRIDETETNELQKIILSALKNKTALSFNRMGDGEVYQLPLPEIASSYNHTQEEDDIMREMSWWNRRIDKKQGEKFVKLVMAALIDSDILGVVSAYRLIRDMDEQPITHSITGRSLLKYVEALGKIIPLNNKIVTEDRVHTIIYTRAFIEDMFQYAKNIVVVGGLSPEQMNLPHHNSINFIALIPEQNKGLPTVVGARSIIDDFEEISENITRECSPGTLALVSGGYAGKALVATAKTAGAVALDIGSLADLLAGYHTRSPADAV